MLWSVRRLRRVGGLGVGLSDFETLEHAEVHHFLPLSEDKVVLLEVLSEQLHRRLPVLHDHLPVLVVLGRLIQVPPPAALLEDLEEQLGVVAAPYETLVVLEELPLEVQLDLVALVDRVVELGEHLLLGVADERFAAQVSVLGQRDL